MSQQDAFDRIVTALHDAALDDTLWPSASALIDEAVGMAGSHLTVVSGHTRDDVELLFGDRYDHGELNEWGRIWARDYFSHDERLPRLSHLPDSQVFHVSEVFPASTLKISRRITTYCDGQVAVTVWTCAWTARRAYTSPGD